MRKLLFLLAFVLALPFTAAFLPSSQGSGGGGGGSGVAFTSVDGPYYLTQNSVTACSDSYNGLSPTFTSGSTGPWCTPNHAVNCGDVIIATSNATYTAAFNSWGAVSNCPSTTGGTTGSGGVYTAILLCGAGNLGTCTINCATSACNSGNIGSGGRTATAACMNINKSHWAVEGWVCTGNGAGHRGFQGDACLTTSTIIGYLAFVNDIVYNAGQGYDTDDCGYGVTTPGNGVDEFAVIGSIAENANQDTICLAAIDVVAPANFDSLTGTHDIFAGNFAWNNSNLQSGCSSDGEAMMFDTWDAHGYSGNGYIYDNIAYTSSWVAVQVFMQTNNASSPTITIDHNTFYDNLVCTPFASKDGQSEINLQVSNSFSWTINTTNNIVQTGRSQTPSSTSCNTTNYFTYAMSTFTGSSVTFSTTGNFFYGQATGCNLTCDTGDNIIWANSGGPGSGNTLGSGHPTNGPGFANTSDLLTNWNSTPSCGSYTNVAACMGWNWTTQSAATATPVADLTPSTSGTSGKGYIPPTTCATNSLWPTWVNYIVYLQWSGTALTEQPGLVQQPCNV